MIICGIDPGIGITGIASLEFNKNKINLKRASCIKTTIGNKHEDRLTELRTSLLKFINEEKPSIAVIEKLVFSQNITTAMNVAEARGVIIQALNENNISIIEIAPSQLKKAVTGNGRAKKGEMTRTILNILGFDNKKLILDDIADALALAWYGIQLI